MCRVTTYQLDFVRGIKIGSDDHIVDQKVNAENSEIIRNVSAHSKRRLSDVDHRVISRLGESGSGVTGKKRKKQKNEKRRKNENERDQESERERKWRREERDT